MCVCVCVHIIPRQLGSSMDHRKTPTYASFRGGLSSSDEDTVSCLKRALTLHHGLRADVPLR